jgi:hypothetical protein
VTSLPQRRHAAPDLLNPDPPAALPVIEFDLLTAPPREREVFDCGWFWGRVGGIPTGRRQVEQEQEAAWQVMAGNVRTMSGLLPFVERQARLIAPPANYRPMPSYEQALASWDDTGPGAA